MPVKRSRSALPLGSSKNWRSEARHSHRVLRTALELSYEEVAVHRRELVRVVPDGFIDTLGFYTILLSHISNHFHFTDNSNLILGHMSTCSSSEATRGRANYYIT